VALADHLRHASIDEFRDFIGSIESMTYPKNPHPPVDRDDEECRVVLNYLGGTQIAILTGYIKAEETHEVRDMNFIRCDSLGKMKMIFIYSLYL